MGGTLAGGKKARETNLAKDPNYYFKLGRKSWENGKRPTGGFTNNPELAKRASKIAHAKKKLK